MLIKSKNTNHWLSKEGSSLVELIIVIALFLILIPSSLGIYIGARKITGQAYIQHQAAVNLGESNDIIRYMQNLDYNVLSKGTFFLIRNPGVGSWLVKSDLVDKDIFERRVDINYALRDKTTNSLYLDEYVPGVNEQDSLDAINQSPPLSSTDVKNELILNSPLTDYVMAAAIDRSSPLDTSDLKDVLLNNSPLSSQMLQAMILRTPPMDSGDIKNVLLASSRLLDRTMGMVENMTPTMDSGDLQMVRDAQAGPILENGELYYDMDTKRIVISILWAPDYLPLDLLTHELYITNWKKVLTY